MHACAFTLRTVLGFMGKEVRENVALFVAPPRHRARARFSPLRSMEAKHFDVGQVKDSTTSQCSEIRQINLSHAKRALCHLSYAPVMLT